MTKRICFLMLLLVVIFWFWVSFANPIAPQLYCYTLKNVEVDNYRAIIEYGSRDIENNETDEQTENGWTRQISHYWSYWDERQREVYEPKAKTCTKCSVWHWLLTNESKVYLLDKSIDITDITQENIDEKAIFIWNIFDSDCWSHYDKTMIYKIDKYWDSYEIVETEDLVLNLEITGKFKKIFNARFFAILIESLVLFLITKIFLKEYKISNLKAILFGIIPTTITLPLLWFGLSLFDFWSVSLEELLLRILLYIVCELLVVIVEAIIIKYWLKISWWKAIISSIACNFFSFILWLFIF